MMTPGLYVIYDHFANHNLVIQHLKDPNSNTLVWDSLTTNTLIALWLISAINDINTGLFIHGKKEFGSEKGVLVKQITFGSTMLLFEALQ